MQQLTKEINKVIDAKRSLELAWENYRCAVSVANMYESENPPIDENTKYPINVIRQNCHKMCKSAKTVVYEQERNYNNVRLKFLEFLVKTASEEE